MTNRFQRKLYLVLGFLFSINLHAIANVGNFENLQAHLSQIENGIKTEFHSSNCVEFVSDYTEFLYNKPSSFYFPNSPDEVRVFRDYIDII